MHRSEVYRSDRDTCVRGRLPTGAPTIPPPVTSCVYETPRVALPAGTVGIVTSAEQHDREPELHLFTVDDPRLWEFRSQLSDSEFAIDEVSDEEWDTFHAIIASA